MKLFRYILYQTKWGFPNPGERQLGSSSGQSCPLPIAGANFFGNLIAFGILIPVLFLLIQNAHGQCLNPAQIDSSHVCPTAIQPVCGCDGITYKNSCEAQKYAGVTSWTPGQCNSSGGCQANFTFAFNTTGTNQITFSNTSFGNFASVQWSFGDGSFSIQNNPTHYYQMPGTYTVCLIITTNTPNCNDTICKTVVIQNTNCINSSLIDPQVPCSGNQPVCGCDGITYPNYCEAKYRAGVTQWTQGPCQTTTACDASFNYSVVPGIAGYTVFFYNSSTGNYDSSSWDFGNGATSGITNPNHTYPYNSLPSNIEVCLTISDSATNCSDSYCQFINITPIGCFNAAAVSLNTPCPLLYVPVCGCDGNTYNNACEAFTHHGITSWTNGPCANAIGCKAEFTTRSQGLLYDFDNTSTGGFTGCSWNFGDGATSHDCDPQHRFPQPGRYLVCLVISDSVTGCTDTFCIPIVISAQNQPCGDSALLTNNPCPTIYEPVCGCDGITYSNSCVALNYAGITSWTTGLCNSSNVVQCRSFFSFSTIPSPIGYEVFFSNQSAGSATKASWSFGDGTVSHQRHPAHTYLVPGYYLVCLTVEDTIRNCSDTYCANVRVSAGSGCVDLTVINPLTACPEIIDPVCGCDGQTYANSCEAYYLNGVTYWTRGTCTNGGCQAGYNHSVDSTGRGVYFSNTSIGGFSRSFWDFGDGNNSNDPNPFHFYNVDASQVFTTCLSIFDSTSNCTDSYCRTISVTKQDTVNNVLSTFEKKFAINVFPNPFGQQTNIDFELKESAIIEVAILNIVGKQIAVIDNGLKTPGRHRFEWNASETAPGAYILTVSINGEKYNHRLLVIR